MPLFQLNGGGRMMRKAVVMALAIAVTATVLTAADSRPTRAQTGEATAKAPATTTLRLIDVGGRKVAFHTAAGRKPAIVFISGGGMDGSAWDPVLATIQRRTGAQLITYDRAGFGGSGEDGRPLVLQHEVDDLKAGLTALGATHDVILVAHSYGGEVATVLANQDPKLVARAVFVDANVPAFNTDAQIARMQATFPPTMDTSTKEGRAMDAYLKAFPTLQRGFRTMSWPTKIPVAVIVSEHPPFATPEEGASWTQAQIDFAHVAANRSVSIAKGSGHIVMTDRPDIVADTVIATYNQASATRRRDRFTRSSKRRADAGGGRRGPDA